MITAIPIINPDIKPRLNSLVTYNPYAEMEHSEQMSTFWKVCTIATIAFGIISGLLLGISEGLTLFPLIGCIAAYKLIDDKADFYDEEVEFNRQLIEHMSYLEPGNIQDRLKQLGISAGQMPVENLKCLLARYRIYEEKRLSNNSIFSSNAGAYTVAMAYILKLIESPTEKRPINGFCIRDYKFDPIRGKLESRASTYASYLDFRIQTGNKSYGLHELKDKSPVNLSKEIFGLNPAAEALDRGWW